MCETDRRADYIGMDRSHPHHRLAEAGADAGEVVGPGPRLVEEVPPIAERMVQTILEQGPGAVYLHDIGEATTWMKYVSPAIELMLGYPASAWMSDPRFWCRILHPEDRDWVTEVDRAAIEGGRDLDIEYRSVHRDGRVIWVHNTAMIIRDVGGRPVARQGLLVDVSPRHEAEEQLAEAEVKYRSLIETSAGVVYLNDPSSSPPRLRYIAPQVEELIGYSADDFADPELWARLLHTEDRAWVLRRTASAIEAGEDLEIEFRMIHRTGRTIWVHDGTRVVRDASGTPIARQGLVVDVTDARETQARLVAVEERYQTLVDRLPIATYVMRVGLPATGATYVSSGIERLTGYPADDWLGERDLLYEILHPADQELAAAHWKSVVAGGQKSFVLDYRIIHRDGRVRWLREMSDLREAGGEYVLEGVWVDITDRMEAEEALAAKTEELTEANERLLELDRIRATFFTTASHELRTPLTSLLGYSDILDQQWDQLSDPQRRDHVRTIHKQGMRMARLVRDVLTASELDQGLLKVDPEPTDVAHVAEAVARSPGSEDVRIQADGRPIALAESVRLTQILSNLLANALRYGEPPVVVDIAKGDAGVEIRVRDGGPGVPDDLQPLLFDRFELSAEAGHLVQQGFGLGLSVARELARAQGGELSLEGASVGATFLLTLPAAPGFS